jgi:hypothetical protein
MEPAYHMTKENPFRKEILSYLFRSEFQPYREPKIISETSDKSKNAKSN